MRSCRVVGEGYRRSPLKGSAADEFDSRFLIPLLLGPIMLYESDVGGAVVYAAEFLESGDSGRGDSFVERQYECERRRKLQVTPHNPSN